MSAFQVSRSEEKVDTLRARLRVDGYLFFSQLIDVPLKELLARFGCPRFQEDGGSCYIVKAGEKLQPDDGGPLMPHTDDFNIEGIPPRLVALHCIRPDKDGHGCTLIGDGYAWLDTLSSFETELLENEWRYQKEGRLVEKHFLSEIGGRRVLRVSFGHLEFEHNERMRRVMIGLSLWFESEAISVAHRLGSLLLWDNWRMIHGRTAYVNLDRELHRYCLD